MTYTQKFTEAFELLGTIDPASHSTEQNTGYLDLAEFARIVILIHCATTQTIDVDIEEGQDSSGTGAQSLDSGAFDTTVAADEVFVAIEIRAEQLTTNPVTGSYSHINVEATPSGAKVFGVQVWGESAQKPADTTNIDQIVG